jgi:hypothetical protein
VGVSNACPGNSCSCDQTFHWRCPQDMGTRD